MTTVQQHPNPLPPPDTAEAELRDLARTRLEARHGFFTHLAVYLAVNAMFWGIWFAIALTSGAWFPWPVFPGLGWGVGLALNAWGVFVERPVTEAQISAEVARLRDRDVR